MSTVLAIETSTPLGSVAVARGDEICFEKRFSSDRSHHSQLFGPLREALNACGGTLRAIVVGTGPASYTGVRIGIAAAQGIALSMGVPVIGLPSVVAADVSSMSFQICGDARRGSYFIAHVLERALSGQIVLLDAREFLRIRREAPANDSWLTFDRVPPLGLADVICVSPSAAKLALLASALAPEALDSHSRAPLEPVYLSAPFVTMPAK